VLTEIITRQVHVVAPGHHPIVAALIAITTRQAHAVAVAPIGKTLQALVVDRVRLRIVVARMKIGQHEPTVFSGCVASIGLAGVASDFYSDFLRLNSSGGK
jgi:hypothetical protein